MTRNRQFVNVQPPAHSLFEALRGLGYSVWAAIADLIDNSIAAGASRVHLEFRWAGEHSHVSLLDDGRGMNADELTAAMRPGSRSPLLDRPQQDLGRFGLGLKTASLSQCRRLTVASRRDGGPIAVRCWDLDHIADTDEWQLLTTVQPDAAELFAPLGEVSSGTMVLWENLDRMGGGSGHPGRRTERSFLEAVERTSAHLSMVFHRYLEGVSPALRIYVNDPGERHPIRPWDPFLRTHPATQRTPRERLNDGGSTIFVQGFVLPHKDRLSQREFDDAAGPEGWVAQQGFYVYRNRRMLLAGSWLGLGRGKRWVKEEPYRIARLSLDITNEYDSDWSIDIRKSRAVPPETYRGRLTDLGQHVRDSAKRVFVHRGAYGPRRPQGTVVRAWKAVERPEGTSYRLDRSHSAIASVLECSASLRPAIEAMLRIVEETVPIQRIWLDTTENDGARAGGFEGEPPDEVKAVAESLFRHLVLHARLSPDEARSRLMTTEPFQDFPALINSIEIPEN